MSNFAIIVSVHVLAVLVAGVSSVVSLALLWWSKAHADRLASALKAAVILDWLTKGAFVLALLTGVVMVVTVPFPITLPWIMASLALYVVVAALGSAFYAPAFRKQMQIAAREGVQGVAYLQAARRTAFLMIVMWILFAAIAFMMQAKPALWAS